MNNRAPNSTYMDRPVRSLYLGHIHSHESLPRTLHSYCNRDHKETTFLGSNSVRFDTKSKKPVRVRFIFEKDSSSQEIMLQVGWIFILQLLIPIYLITLRLVICFEAFKGLILVFSLTFFRL
jgi:hypothetical protein